MGIPLVAAQLLAAFGIVSYFEKKFEQRMQEDVELITRALQRPISNALIDGSVAQVLTVLNASADFRRVYGATVYAETGEVLATSGDTDLKPRVPRSELPTTGGGLYEEVAGREVYAYYVPIWVNSTGQSGMLRITRKKSEIDEFLTGLRMAALGFVLLGTALTATILFGGHYVALGRAFANLRSSMERIHQGEREHRPKPEGPSEVRDIIWAFNDMMNAVERAQGVLTRERETKTQLVRQMLYMEKMASIGRIAGGIAHELGSPLGTFSGRIERVLRNDDVPERVRSELGKLSREVGHMTQIVSGVLDFARADQRNQRIVDIVQVTRSAASSLSDSWRSRINVEVEKPGERLWVFADSTRMQQAMSNLLRNAAEATSEDDAIWVRIERRGGSKVRVSVCDSGSGVPDEIADKLFEPFVTTRRGRGTGLGLPIAQAIVRQHGGEIVVERREGGGSRFSFEIPLTSDMEDSA